MVADWPAVASQAFSYEWFFSNPEPSTTGVFSELPYLSFHWRNQSKLRSKVRKVQELSGCWTSLIKYALQHCYTPDILKNLQLQTCCFAWRLWRTMIRMEQHQRFYFRRTDAKHPGLFLHRHMKRRALNCLIIPGSLALLWKCKSPCASGTFPPWGKSTQSPSKAIKDIVLLFSWVED